ncbi:MAG: gliding motility protein GldN [Salibacteraceae bacterium]
MKKLLGLIVLAGIIACITPDTVKAQDVLDGIYQPEHTESRRVIPYAHLREADVMWLKRVWRRIDMQEKINHPMYYPETPVQGRKSLFDVIKEGIVEDGSITAYDPGPLGDDDMFTKSFTREEVKNILYATDTAWSEDIETGEYTPQLVTIETKSADVKWYDIKEEWFFDRQRSVMEVRIIGICPLTAKTDELTGEFRGYKPLFWIYFPAVRHVFVKAEVFNRTNDTERRTYEDLFWKRQFGSYITKESNVYDRGIEEYKTGLDALLEAEQIKEKIFQMEHDLWSF